MPSEPNIVDETAKKIAEVLAENKCAYKISYDFPKYKILPPECELAIKVLENNGIKITIELHEIGN